MSKYIPIKPKSLEESRKALAAQIKKLKDRGVKFRYLYVRDKK